MKDYTNASPAYRGTIQIPENTDPANADEVLNITYKQLYDNIHFIKLLIDEGGTMQEATSDDIREIIDGAYDPDAGEDDTGQIDDDGTIIEEATAEDIQEIMDSYWTD